MPTDNEYQMSELIRARNNWEEYYKLDPTDFRYDLAGRQTMICEGCGRRHAIIGRCFPVDYDSIGH